MRRLPLDRVIRKVEGAFNAVLEPTSLVLGEFPEQDDVALVGRTSNKIGRPGRSLPWANPQLLDGLDARRSTGAELARPLFLSLLAEAHRTAGDPVAALKCLREAEEVIARTGERWWEPEVQRLVGELLPDVPVAARLADEAEGRLQRSLDLARGQLDDNGDRC